MDTADVRPEISGHGNKWFGTAESDQPLVGQIQVPNALISAQRQADPCKKLEVNWKKNVVLDSCQSFLRYDLARQGWKTNSPNSIQILMAYCLKEPWTPPFTKSAWKKPNMALQAYSWLPAHRPVDPTVKSISTNQWLPGHF